MIGEVKNKQDEEKQEKGKKMKRSVGYYLALKSL